MDKMILNEDIFDDAIVVIEEPEESNILPGPTTPEENGVSSLLLTAINDEIATIDKYNVILANIQAYPEFILVIQDILNEENNHVGMLQELLKKVSPNAENISDGEEEAKEILRMNEGFNFDTEKDADFYIKAAVENIANHIYNHSTLDADDPRADYFVENIIQDDQVKKHEILLKNSILSAADNQMRRENYYNESLNEAYVDADKTVLDIIRSDKEYNKNYHVKTHVPDFSSIPDGTVITLKYLNRWHPEIYATMEKISDNNWRWTYNYGKGSGSSMIDNHEVMRRVEEVDRGCYESLQEGVKMNESVESPYFKAFITNLGKYNEGDLEGEWVEFPIDEQAFEEVLDRIGIDDYYEEWFVTDYDCNLDAFNWSELGEYPSYDELNEFGELVESIDDMEAVDNALEVNSDLREVIEGLSDGSIVFVLGIRDTSDLAHYYIDEMGFDITPELAEEYIDYEMLGRDLSFDSYEDDDGNDISAGEYWCGDEDASDREIGEAFVEEVGPDGVQNVDAYFDYDSYGRDIEMENNITFTKDGIIIEE